MTRLLSFNYNVRQGTCICFILKQISGKKGLGVFVESPLNIEFKLNHKWFKKKETFSEWQKYAASTSKRRYTICDLIN